MILLDRSALPWTCWLVRLLHHGSNRRLVAILHSGAYARSASPLGFLSHPSPAEALVADHEVRLIRRRGNHSDYLRDVETSPTRRRGAGSGQGVISTAQPGGRQTAELGDIGLADAQAKPESVRPALRGRVLVVAFHFPPQAGSSGVLRAQKFCRYLPEFGSMPTVLTVKASAYERTDPMQLGDIPADVEILRAFSLDARASYVVS